MVLGAILAGSSDKQQQLLTTFGVNLGIAFQAIDDHLGLYGDEQVIGKPVDSDVKEAKKTLHFAEGYRRANSGQREFLRHVWGNKNITLDELGATRALIDTLKVREHVLTSANVLSHKSRNVIPKITSNQAAQNLLGSMTEFVVERNF